jgi:predicted RNA-binding Zn ribbon-like protein
LIFSHDTERSLQRAVELVNSAYDTPGGLLTDIAALAAFAERADLSDVPELSEADIDDVLRLGEELRAVFDATDEAIAAARVNDLIGGGHLTPRLTDHDGHDWHMHYSAPGAALAERLRLDGGMALAQVIVAGERERLQICAAPDCARVLVDLSRNRSKRYCDARTCGNRLHVAAYRERRRGTAAS